MKNLFKTLGLVAVAATTLVGCVKTVEQEPALTSHKVTIKVDQLATKTAIVEGEEVNTFVWSAEDVDRFKVWENGVEASSINLVTEDNYQTIALECEFPGGAESPFTYDATMAANWEEDEPYIPAVQDGSKDVYDPNADILVAKTVTVDESTDNLVMRFRRPVVVNKMTLSGLEAGETINTISITTQGGEDLTGSFNTETEEWTGMSDEIVINTDEEVDDNGEISVFFVTMPASVALTITATSDDNSYTKAFAEGSLISFEENMVTRFEVAMNKNVKQDVDVWFETNPVELTTENYGDFEGQEASTDPAVTVTYAIDGDDIYDAFDTETGAISLNGEAGTATVTASFPGNEYYNAAEGSYDIVVAKLDDATIEFDNDPVELTTLNYDEFTGQVAQTYPDDLQITYSWDGDDIGEVDPDTGEVTLNGEVGSATVTATSDDARYEEVSSSYTIVVDKGDAEVQFNSDVYEVPTTQGTAQQEAITNPEGLDLTYSIDGDDVGEIDETSGIITLNGTSGTATVTASFPGNEYYNAAEGSYTLIVSKVATSIDDFAEASVTAYSKNGSTDTDIAAFDTCGDFEGQATWTDPYGLPLTYSIDDTTIGTIDAETGTVTLTGKPGTATVTASYDGDETYEAATSKSYTIVVKELKKASYTVTQSATSAPTSITDTQSKSWSFSYRGSSSGGFSVQGNNSTNRYWRVTGGSSAASHMTFTTSAYEEVEIKRVGVTASGSANNTNHLTATISVGGTTLGSATDLNSHTETPPTTVTSEDNTGEEPATGEISIALNRATLRNSYIYFKALFVVYAEDPE